MTYKKGKDIKIPFDCLWYYFTRKFEVTYDTRKVSYVSSYESPEGFETIWVQSDYKQEDPKW